MTSFMYKIKDLAPHRLFILQFISNKTKVTLILDESYHNTSIYHINKNKYKFYVKIAATSKLAAANLR